MPTPLRILDLGRVPYAPAWETQQRLHSELLADPAAPATLILVEHDPVITVSQRKNVAGNLLASREHLAKLGIDVQPTDRGGDITYHGPGQLVAYPILRLATWNLNVGRYMKLLEHIVIDTVAEFGVKAFLDPAAIGVWVESPQGPPAKICAMGVRVRRNITLHGLALNVTTDLAHFATIVPCGLADRPVTSLQKLLGKDTPAMEEVKEALVASFEDRLEAKAMA